MSPFDVLPTDQRFTDSPNAGDPECVCSRCGNPIPASGSPIRVFVNGGNAEYRYHPACVGMRMESEDDCGTQDQDAP
jgi:hypothetical protein